MAMRRYRITTPVPEWEGKVGTVTFVKGAAECEADDDAAALYYFWCQGYGIEPLDDGPAYKPPGTKTVEDEIAEMEAKLADLRARAAQATTTSEAPKAPKAPKAPEAAEMPKKSASTDEWRAYAVASGMPEEQAATKSRDELVADLYTKEG